MCVSYWSSVCQVYPNHEVVMFQPLKLTTLKPTICRLFFYSLLLNPPWPLLLPSNVLTGGISLLSLLPIHQLTPCCCTIWSAHTVITRIRPIIARTPFLLLTRQFHCPTSLPLPVPCHACRIAVAAIISSNMSPSCFSASAWQHHGSWIPPLLTHKRLLHWYLKNSP